MKPSKILIVDLIGMLPNATDALPDCSEVKQHIESKGGVFHHNAWQPESSLVAGKLHFFYLPHVSTEEEILRLSEQGQYDAVIAAATIIPADAKFPLGGVRIGAGTGNMRSSSWGGGSGKGGDAPLMNTPSFNSRATAQMVLKAIMQALPDINLNEMHSRVVANDFDTGRDLVDYPTSKIEGKRIAVLGYGNIGREVAKLAKALHMEVVIFARAKHRQWIESEGFQYADSVENAVTKADVISSHLGLGADNCNVGIIGHNVLSKLNYGAVVINFDRGEVLDTQALDIAMTHGQVRYAAIDADVFVEGDSGRAFGPMTPYLEIQQKHPDKLLLLPHAAADTEHYSRVAGAKQAVDQIYKAIVDKEVSNLVGELPEGYCNCGPHTIAGIGKVTSGHIESINDEKRREIALLAQTVADFWQGESADVQSATMAANRLMHLMDKNGLLGPYE